VPSAWFAVLAGGLHQRPAARAPGGVDHQLLYGLDSATSGLDCGFMLPRRLRRDYPSGNPGPVRDDSPAAGTLPGKNLAVPPGRL